MAAERGSADPQPVPSAPWVGPGFHGESDLTLFWSGLSRFRGWVIDNSRRRDLLHARHEHLGPAGKRRAMRGDRGAGLLASWGAAQRRVAIVMLSASLISVRSQAAGSNSSARSRSSQSSRWSWSSRCGLASVSFRSV
jgi:hypothetical protein